MTTKPNDVRVSRELLENLLDDPRLVVRMSSDYIVEIKAALAQPADQQGEPVAAMYEDGSVLTRADCIDDEVFAICCKAQTPLYRHAQPATAKVVLPGRLPEQSDDDLTFTGCHNEGWNACLDEVAKLNTPQ